MTSDGTCTDSELISDTAYVKYRKHGLKLYLAMATNSGYKQAVGKAIVDKSYSNSQNRVCT